MSAQLATFVVANHLYGVPVEQVQEVLHNDRCTSVPLAPGAVRGLMNLRGEVVPVIDLRSRLSLPSRDETTRQMSVVVRVGGEVVSLLVDVIGDVVDVDEEIFEVPPDTLGGPGRALLKGAYKLQDRLLLALDVERAVVVAA